MIALLEQKRDELMNLCTRYRVRRLALFGSATGKSFNPATSDLDLAVEFEPLDPGRHKESYFGLLAALEDLFQRPVDLVEYAPISNPYFLRALLESQVMLYETA